MYQFPLFYSFSYERQRKHATTILWDIPFKIDVSANDFVRNVYFDSPANFDQWFISIANQKTKLDKYQSDFQSPSFVYIKSRQAKLKKKSLQFQLVPFTNQNKQTFTFSLNFFIFENTKLGERVLIRLHL